MMSRALPNWYYQCKAEERIAQERMIAERRRERLPYSQIRKVRVEIDILEREFNEYEGGLYGLNEETGL